mgnify:CR=1 FL=1
MHIIHFYIYNLCIITGRSVKRPPTRDKKKARKHSVYGLFVAPPVGLEPTEQKKHESEKVILCVNYATVSSVTDAMISAGLNTDIDISVIYGVESAAIIQSHPADIEDGDNTENLMYVFKLLAKELNTDSLNEFKEELIAALADSADSVLNDYIRSASMMGMSFDEVEADVKAIKEDICIPSMDEMWGKDETHDFNL